MRVDLPARVTGEGAVERDDRIHVFFSVRRVAWMLGLVAGSIYFAARSSFGPIWNDTAGLVTVLFDPPQGKPPLDWELVWRILVTPFGRLDTGGFRPLQIIPTNLSYFGFGSLSPWLEAVAALLIGITAAMVFFVAYRFLKDRIGALVATLLFICAGPYLSADAVVLSGFQTVVVLVLCGSLLCYWRYYETTSPRRRKLWLGALIALLFLGPWYREYTGLASILIFAAEAWRRRRPTWLMGLSTLTLAHALFPTALVHFLVFPELPLLPVFQIGSLGSADQIALASGAHAGLSDTIAAMLPGLVWDLGFYFLPLLPPTMIALAYGGFWMAAWRRARLLPRPTFIGSIFGPHWLPLWGVVLTALFAGYLVFQLPYVTGWNGFGLAAAFGLGALGLAIDPLIAFWFLLSLLPFIVVFHETVHLIYALVPASIIVAGGLARLWEEGRRWPAVLRCALAGAIALLVVDQGLGAVAVFRVLRGIYAGEVAVAKEIKARIPSGAFVISNALSAMDIEVFSNGYFRTLYSVGAGVPANRIADTDAVLAKFLAANPDKVYFLDIEHPFTPGKYLYHALKYVRDRSVPLRALGTLHTTDVRYPFLDPLKLFFDVPYVNFLGAPDLVNDFYDGPALSGAPFRSEVFATYRLYQAVGTKVDPWHPEGNFFFVLTDGRYNVIVWNGRYFALPVANWPLDTTRLLSRQYPVTLIGDSLDDIKREIAASGPIPGPNDGLALIQEGYHRYNIVRWGEVYFGVPQTAGPINAGRLASDGGLGYLRGRSIADVERQIDELGDP